MDEIEPFGDVPQKVTAHLDKTLTTWRNFIAALDTAHQILDGFLNVSPDILPLTNRPTVTCQSGRLGEGQAPEPQVCLREGKSAKPVIVLAGGFIKRVLLLR